MSGISWSVLAGLIRALSVFAPLGGAQGLELQKLLGYVALLLERGEAGRHALEELSAQIDVMVAQGNRSPSVEELAALRSRSDVAHEIIQEAAGVVTPPAEPVDPVEPVAEVEVEKETPTRRGRNR